VEDLPPSAESEPTVLSGDRMVLVVTAPGIEAEHILPAGREPPPWGTHVAQPWKPVVCSCGKQHTAEDGEFLTLLVGQPQPELRTNKNTFTLAIVPNLDKPPYAGYPYVAPEPESGPFEDWASKVVANFTGFFVGGCLCTCWDNIRILWDPATELLGCGKERDPSQDNVPVCLPEHARLRFAAEPAPDSLVNAMGRLFDRNQWISPQCMRLMVALSLDAEHGSLMDASEAWGLLSDRTHGKAKILCHEPNAPRGTVPILSVLGG
jgi:hypothetical protein